MNVANIQRYAVHDGDGIRTTVFFKGCPLACCWCHNPETIGFEAEGIFHAERCVSCGGCGAPCEYGAREVVGKAYEAGELAKLVMRDRIFFGDMGGVTLSGGEPLAQNIADLLALLKILKRDGIGVAIDTSGDVPWERIADVMPYTDVFLYDVKTACGELHMKYTGRSNDRILANLEKLAQMANVWLRIPVIGGVNDGDEMADIIALMQKIAPGRRITLLPYHAIGRDKWQKLEKTAPPYEFGTPTAQRMAEIADAWAKAGFRHVNQGG